MNDLIKIKTLAITTAIICLLTVFLVFRSFAQAEIGFHLDYSAKYHSGGGIEGGAWINNSYVGANTQIYFSRNESVPASINLKYGYFINGFIPFVVGGYYSCGKEAVESKAGTKGYEYGAGLSYQFKDSPIKLSIQQTNINTNFSISLVR